MTLSEYNWLADENIHPELIKHFSARLSLQSIYEARLQSASDTEILSQARANNQIVLTQDSDFGKLIYTQSQPFIGIVYLRPGHLNAGYQIGAIEQLLENGIEVTAPFIIVITYSNEIYHIRVRNKVGIV